MQTTSEVITESKYKKVGHLFCDKRTPSKVCTILNDCYNSGSLIKVYLGDTVTGKAWNEENDIIGTVGRTTGIYKVPLLVAPGECGAPSLLDHCIVAIKDVMTGEYLYTHATFHTSVITIGPSKEPGYKYSTFTDGEIYGNHKTLADALKVKDLLS